MNRNLAPNPPSPGRALEGAGLTIGKTVWQSQSGLARSCRLAWVCQCLVLLGFLVSTSVAVADRQRPESVEPSRSAIDQFVRQSQTEAGIAGNPLAARSTLIRRVTLDLTGLPPSPNEVDAFAQDTAPDAYERLVDRLLASPHYGERMAQFWLDLARYADSDGYHDDTNRSMWPYRDYVIGAFNSNKPFDEFTIEQLAGDLLSKPTQEQLVATAFHRNAPTSSEDGANPDEYRARYAVDRVNTTAQIWLGMTVQCAECHDHKSDPITTKEYYELFAFFNQTPERPLFRGLHAPPSIPVATTDQQLKLDQWKQQISIAAAAYDDAVKQPDTDAVFRAWTKQVRRQRSFELPPTAIVCEFRFEDSNDQSTTVANTGARRRAAKIRQQSLVESDLDTELATDLEPVASTRFPADVFGTAMQLDGRTWLDLGQLFEVRRALPFSIEAWMKFAPDGGPVFSKIDGNDGSRGFEVRVSDGRIVVRLVEKWPEQAVQVATVARFQPGQWMHLSVTLDGQTDPNGIFVAVNGVEQDLSIDRQGPITRLRNRAPFLIGSSNQTHFHGTLDEIRFYKWPLPINALKELPNRGLQTLIQRAESDIEGAESAALRDFFLFTTHAPAVAARKELQRLERERQLFEQALPRVRVMREITPARKTNVFVRGDFRDLGEEVQPGTPSIMPPLKSLHARPNRLDLAEWLVRENSQHTATVMANRTWAQFFGRGVVATLDDFGVNGASASYPQLLNWLRDQFLRSDWDTKSLVRAIVLSATYRQSSLAGAESWTNDPHNELLARGPRHRLSAEAVRDHALAVSKLLSGRVGGPSVRPYQPEGLWREMAKGDEADKQYQPSRGEALYRRGLYTFWKRSIHYPMFALLDAPNREVCTSKRATTNTPTQALVLLNDPTFIEASRHFARRIIDSSSEFETRIQFAFREAVSRRATNTEVEVLKRLLQQTRDEFADNPDAVGELLQVGQMMPGGAIPMNSSQTGGRDDDQRSVEQAAWTILAQTILTLDEAITKE